MAKRYKFNFEKATKKAKKLSKGTKHLRRFILKKKKKIRFKEGSGLGSSGASAFLAGKPIKIPKRIRRRRRKKRKNKRGW